LSTRVHELAKELGLKSQELIERIQKWGLDVKANALASLDPPMVDRIRELMDQPMDREGATSPALPDQGVTAPPPPSVPPRAGSSGESDAVTKAPKPAGSAPAPPSMVRTEPDPGHAAATSSTPPPGVAPQQRLVPGSSPAGTTRSPSSVAPSSVPSAPVAPRPGAPSPSAPLSRPGGFSGTRPTAGPLSAHTPHRGTGPRPGGGGSRAAPGSPRKSAGSSVAHFGCAGVGRFPASQKR
jgi:translation initiation factor IF-2